MGARVIAVAVAAVAYVLFSHWLMTGAPASPWNAVVIVGPMMGAAGVVAWQRRHWLLAVIAALALAALVVRAWRGDEFSVNFLYVCQHVRSICSSRWSSASPCRPGASRSSPHWRAGCTAR